MDGAMTASDGTQSFKAYTRPSVCLSAVSGATCLTEKNSGLHRVIQVAGVQWVARSWMLLATLKQDVLKQASAI
eukprot:21541-Eustigmatos_ZCMA.PRE.1